MRRKRKLLLQETCHGRRATGRTSSNFSPEEAHAAADGQVEGGAEGEAQGAVHAWDRPGVGHTQRHGEKVHERREATHVAWALGVSGTLVW